VVLSVVMRRALHDPHALTLVQRLSIGRGPENDVVIPNTRVSWTHAVVWREGTHAMVHDLGTRNGTFLEGRQIVEPTIWPVGGVVRIGDTELVLAEEPQEDLIAARNMAVEDVETGLQYPLRRAHFVIGPAPDACLRIPGVDRMVLVCRANGEVRITGEEQDRLWAEGETLSVGKAQLKLVEAPLDWDPTLCDDDAEGYPPYQIEATLTGLSGPMARLVDLSKGREATLTAPNRVSLLYYLADAHIQDRQRQINASSLGWRTNAAASIAVWGRIHGALDPRRLKTLIHNVRTDIRQQGLDPWCVEKRRGTLRLRVQDAVVL
jgi:hypothetical protein